MAKCADMKSWLLLFLIAFTARLAGQEISVPGRPADHVLDQTGKVPAAERKAAQAEMELVAGKSGLGVYLVLLNSSAEEPPADVARRLAQAWKGSADRAVVLTAPDVTPPVIVALAGDSLSVAPEDQVRRMTETAVAAGQRAAPGFPAMLATARSVVTQVNEFRRTGVPGPKPVNSVVNPGPADGTKSNLVLWIAGGTVACCLLAVILMRRGRRSALIFPPTQFRRRFSAPHSGGNDALVLFGKR